jgi:hypothetical protein
VSRRGHQHITCADSTKRQEKPMSHKEVQSVTINGVTIKQGDIVRIKFRKLEEVMKDNRQQSRVSDLLDFYGIDGHMPTFLQGVGHFKVTELRGLNDYLKLARDNDTMARRNRKNAKAEVVNLEEIVIHDFNTDSPWHLNEILIESISVENEVADSYFSETHQLSLLLIDSTLYINGQPLTLADSKIMQMFEKVMADAAINNVLNLSEQKHQEEDEDTY